jgi:hypothetical protein
MKPYSRACGSYQDFGIEDTVNIYIWYIHNISSLEEKVWIQTVCNKFIFRFITILSNSRQNISYKIIFTFNKNTSRCLQVLNFDLGFWYVLDISRYCLCIGKVTFFGKWFGYKLFAINLYFGSSQYYRTLDKTLVIKLSLHLICFTIRLYSCNINSHLVNQWFSFCIST